MNSRLSLPKTPYGRALLSGAIALPLLLYATRLLMAIDLEPPDEFSFGLLVLIGLLLLLVVAVPALLILAIVYIDYGLRRSGHLSPLLLVVGLAIALLSPLLPLPPHPEITFFRSHRPLFEQVVTLARQRQLPRSSACSAADHFGLPPAARQVSDRCVQVATSPGFTVEFTRRFYRPIVYVDRAEQIQTVLACNGQDGFVDQQLDPHWFFCHRDPN